VTAATLTLAGLHATGAIFLTMGLFLAWAGLPDWKPGDTANPGDQANYWMIARGILMALIGAAGVLAT
jgi:hypothetical protein